MELLGSSANVVWTVPNDGSTASTLTQIWSPTLWQINGSWWIYFTATPDGTNTGHNIYALQSSTSNPLGPYTFAGQINTGRPSIDPSILTINGTNYLMYVSITGGFNGVWITALSDPLTPTGNNALLIYPDQPWERGAGTSYNYPVSEGPTALYYGGKTFIVYSGSDTATPVYCLGMITYAGAGDVTDYHNWTKTGPLFQQNLGNRVYGPGRGTFTLSPDGQQNWLIYAAKTTNTYTPAGRTTRAQQFSYNADGTPNFGVPVSLSTSQTPPSGEAQVAPPPQIAFARQGELINGAPTLAALNGLLYIGFRADDSSNTLWVDTSFDGSGLQGAQHISNVSMGSTPAMAAFNNNMYVAFQSNSDDSLFVCTYALNPNPVCTHITGAGSPQVTIHMSGAPSLWVVNGRLYLAYWTSANDSNGAHHIAILSSANGTTFDQGRVFSATAGSPPALAAYNGHIVTAFQANDSRSVLYLQQYPYNLQSTTQTDFYPTQIKTAPALMLVQPSTSSFPTLMIAYEGNDSNQYLNYEPFYGVSLYVSTQDTAMVGSSPAEIVWTPSQGANANKATMTVAFRSKDSSNHLWLGSKAVP
jgi:GH43 family beta-xylosidase